MSSKQKLKDPTDTLLYRLIEAGHMARHDLLQRLSEHGLVAGDDAIILALTIGQVHSDHELSEATGLPPAQLLSRQHRLVRLDIITRSDPTIAGEAGSRLTEKGKVLRNLILEHWTELEEILTGNLKPKRKKQLKNALTSFSDLLD